MNHPILEFQGEFRFLSNFWPAKVNYEGIDFPSVEHAYVAAKTTDEMTRKFIATIDKPGDVKRYGRKLTIRAGWDQMKLAVMEDLVAQKFVLNPHLGRFLLLTGERELIEGNCWGDTFWGVCNGHGQNNLGKILMDVRSKMRGSNEQ